MFSLREDLVHLVSPVCAYLTGFVFPCSCTCLFKASQTPSLRANLLSERVSHWRYILPPKGCAHRGADPSCLSHFSPNNTRVVIGEYVVCTARSSDCSQLDSGVENDFSIISWLWGLHMLRRGQYIPFPSTGAFHSSSLPHNTF